MLVGGQRLIRIALERKAEDIYDRKEAELKLFCDELCEKAMEFRITNPEAHNFTGNLLNSIAVVLYRRGKFVQATLSSEYVQEAIAPKMTHPYIYHWSPDYEGARSDYEPTFYTNKGYGEYDAKSFVAKYKPKKKPIFEIVCAYTVEYARFVEMQRQTTGYLNLVQFVQISAPQLAK